MTIANQITYRDMESSEALNEIINKRLRKLERFSSDIRYGRVVLESPHNHKHKGKDFQATLEIEVKGNPVTVTQNDPSIHIAVRDAFNIAERKLKSHSEQLHQPRRETPSSLPDSNLDAMAG